MAICMQISQADDVCSVQQNAQFKSEPIFLMRAYVIRTVYDGFTVDAMKFSYFNK